MKISFLISNMNVINGNEYEHYLCYKSNVKIKIFYGNYIHLKISLELYWISITTVRKWTKSKKYFVLIIIWWIESLVKS